MERQPHLQVDWPQIDALGLNEEGPAVWSSRRPLKVNTRVEKLWPVNFISKVTLDLVKRTLGCSSNRLREGPHVGQRYEPDDAAREASGERHLRSVRLTGTRAHLVPVVVVPRVSAVADAARHVPGVRALFGRRTARRAVRGRVVVRFRHEPEGNAGFSASPRRRRGGGLPAIPCPNVVLVGASRVSGRSGEQSSKSIVLSRIVGQRTILRVQGFEQHAQALESVALVTSGLGLDAQQFHRTAVAKGRRRCADTTSLSSP